MLKAHSRLFEQLAFVADLALLVVCWVGAYALRFHVFGHGDIPPFRDYALQLLPILIVWGLAFRAFDLYRFSIDAGGLADVWLPDDARAAVFRLDLAR